jgi:hypothetical protein
MLISSLAIKRSFDLSFSYKSIAILLTFAIMLLQKFLNISNKQWSVILGLASAIFVIDFLTEG